MTSWAVVGTNAARVAPASASFLPPNRKVPTTVNLRGSTVRNEIFASSPILNFPSSNVLRSSATSSGARGWRPLMISFDWFTDCFGGNHGRPKVGAWLMMASPSVPVTNA